MVTVSAPASAVAGSNVTVNISATSSDWNLQRVEIYHNDSQVETLNFTSLATAYEYPNASLGTHRFYAVGLDEDNNGVRSNTAEIEVVDDESDIWPDINGDGYLDQELAELDRPDRSGEVGRVTDNKVELIIEDQSTYVLDFEHISIDGVPNIINDDYLLASVRFPYLKGYQYQMQYKQFSGDPKTSPPGTPLEGTPWVNWNNLPIPDSPLENRNYILWCDFENLWYNWNNIPQKFRVIQYGRSSFALGEPSIEDVNGDGVDDKVQRVGPAVYGEDSDELFIKVDCPEGVIGCDKENAQLVIKKNGQWIIVDENQSIAREITTDDDSSAEYPEGGYTRYDRVVAVKRDEFPLFFYFAEMGPLPVLVPLNSDSDSPEDDLIAISKPLEGNVTVAVQSGQSRVKLWRDDQTAYASTEAMPETLYVEGLEVSGNPWDVTLLFSSDSGSQVEVKATVFDATFGSSKIREQDVNMDLTDLYAKKTAPFQWKSTRKVDLSDYLTPVSRLASDGLKWKINDESVPSSIQTYSQPNEEAPDVDDIITYNVEVSHQQYSHLSDRFILVIYPVETATEYRDWVSTNAADPAWADDLPRVYKALWPDNTDPGPEPDPEPDTCDNWETPDDLAADYHYHPGAAYEMRTEALEGEGQTQGNQATYDSSGKLITTGLGAGTADRVSPSTDRSDHRDVDVKPFIWAAQLDGNPVEGTTVVFLDIPENLTHPLMYHGEKLDEYLERRPIKASNPLDPDTCP